MSASPLDAAKDAIRNLRLLDLKKKQQEAVLQLKNPALNREKIISLQKEILDLQVKLNDLFAPAIQASPAIR